MALLGKYCKAYRLADLRGYAAWHEAAENARYIDPATNRKPRPLEADSIVYLQQDHTVTDGIFLGEHLLFQDVTPEWIDFCRTQLEFVVEKVLVPSGVSSDNHAT